MPSKIISGPINSGKTTLVLKKLAACDPGKTGTIVVPDRFTAAELRKRFSEGSKTRFQALRSDSIQDWSSFIRGLACPTLPVATRAHSTLIVLGLLSRIKLPHFGSSASSYGTAAGFAHTILKLKENLIESKDLTQIIEGLGESRPRERDLIRVYEAYDKELSRLGLLDEPDLTLLAIANAPRALSEMKTIAFDEFVLPTPAELAMLRALGKGLKDTQIIVTCPLAHGEDERPFAEWLSRAREIWLAVCKKEEKLAAPKTKKPKVRVLTAPSPAQEARHVALMVSGDCVVATKPDDSFLEWYLSEAHSMELLPEHPTLDGARASPLAHELTSPDMVEKLPTSANIKSFAGELLKLAQVKAKARGWIRGLKERRGHGRVAARSLTAVSIVEETLRSLASSSPMLGKTKPTREQFAQVLSDELARRTASSTMLESVLPFRNLRLGAPLATETKKLIVPRMIEGSFPTRTGETLFFGDWKEETIRRIFPDAEDCHARESYAFETMMKKSAVEVILIGPAVNDSGSETIPSPFSVRFGEPEGLGPVILDRTHRGRKKEELEGAFEVEVARISGAQPHDSPFAAYMGVLTAQEPRALVRRRFTEGEIGATALERYGNCPFSFFAGDVLKVKEELEDTPQIRSLDRGKLVHEVLARYYRDLPPPNLPLTKGEGLEKRVRAITSEVWEGIADGLEYVSPGLMEREIEEVSGMAEAVVRAEESEAKHITSPLTPSNFEWEFGRNHDNALTIEVAGDEPLYVRGRVDRVDLDSDRSRFLVIDYKTGGAEAVINRIEKGEHLQLPLYIDAVGRHLYPDLLAMGGLLVVIREMESGANEKKTAGKQKGLVREEFEGSCFRVGRAHSKVGAERMGELIGTAREHAAGFAKGIRDGIFAASSEAECRYCYYGDICRHKRLSAD